MQSKKLMSTCSRSSQSARSRRVRRSIRKSRTVFGSVNDCQQAVQATEADVPDENCAPEAEDAASTNNMELLELISSNSADRGRQNGVKSESDDPDASELSMPKGTDEEERQVIIFEGNKAILVDAKPWPTRPARQSVRDAYKEPNPKLTPAELRYQARMVKERRAVDDENQRERRRLKYLRGIYCLPKTLIMDSKARLIGWYQPPNKEEAENVDGLQEKKVA